MGEAKQEGSAECACCCLPSGAVADDGNAELVRAAASGCVVLVVPNAALLTLDRDPPIHDAKSIPKCCARGWLLVGDGFFTLAAGDAGGVFPNDFNASGNVASAFPMFDARIGAGERVFRPIKKSPGPLWFVDSDGEWIGPM